MTAHRWFWHVQQYLTSNRPWIPGTIASVISVGLWQLGVWLPLEQFSYNALFKLRPALRWDERIAVIAIDEASLAQYGQFPWDRRRYVKLLQVLEKAKPAAIGFDIIWTDSSPVDEELAAAVKKTGNVVLAVAWDKEGQLLPPVPVIDQVAANAGQILHAASADGMSRQATLFVESLPSLGLAMLEVAKPQLDPSLRLPQPNAGEPLQKVWINWPGNTNAVPTYSFAEVSEGKIDPQVFTNRLVLVGHTGTGLDTIITPLNTTPPTSGVYLHAALIDNLLNRRLLERLPNRANFLILCLIGPISSWILFNRPLKQQILLGLALPPAWFAIALATVTGGNLWIPVAAPVGTVLLAGLGIQLREHYEKQQLMNLFALHVAPEMAELIWQRKDEIFENGELEAQELTATVLFMDIRNFTSISESLKPRELLAWLNLYLDTMAQCIMEHGGVIDKYIGDAIMAVFGIPFPHQLPQDIKRDATAAINASIAMHKRLRQLNQQFKVEGRPMIQFGIGIHTGPVVAGTVGGARRISYSVVGDTVNVAARLESMTKNLTADSPYKILLTDRTFSYICDRYRGQEVGEIQLRGKETETVVYTIAGYVSKRKKILKIER
jgi:adenylate cyclase